jgi:hypothetical protein
MYTYGDKAIDVVMPEYAPMPRAHKAAVAKRVENRLAGAIFGFEEPTMNLAKYGQVVIQPVLSNDEKAMAMLSEPELVQSIERIAENIASNFRILEKELG